MKNIVIQGLYDALKHGDDEHKQWLKEAITAWYDDLPIPEPRGNGNKEKRIAELEREIRELKAGFNK